MASTRQVNPERWKEYDRRYRERHREKRLAHNREYYRNTYRFSRYGLTIEEGILLLKKQNNSCAICKTRLCAFHVDHDHITNKVRGLLCGACNRGLGHFRDSTAVLTNAVNYLSQA